MLHQDLKAQIHALKSKGCDKIYADKVTVRKAQSARIATYKLERPAMR